MAASSSSEGSKEEVQTLAQNPSSENEEPKPETGTKTEEENLALAQNPSSESSSEEDEEDPESETEPETKAEAETPKWRSRRKNPQTPTQSSSKSVPKAKTGISVSNKLSYSFQFQDETKTGFAVSDLVWGKVRSHPWWPGQIFDPSEASSLASKHRRKNCHLVAYFGDKTFGWNESSVLKPFQKIFSRMEKQSKSEAFTTAVDASLAEVSRRVGAAFTCSCFENKEFSEVKIDNTGIKSYTYSPSGDVLFIRNSFDPVEFINFLTDLGRNPNCETEMLDLAIVKSQLKAFDRFRGCKLDPPEFNLSFVNFEEEDELNVPVSALMSRKRKPKPVIENPVVQKPVIEKPVIEKPGNEEKVVEEPIIEKLVVEKPVNETEIIEKTVIENPVIEKPVNGKPVNEKEVTEELVTEKPVIGNPVVENTVTEKPITEKKIIQREGSRRKRKMSEILNKNEDIKTPKTVRKVKVGGPSGSTNSGKNKKKSLDSLGDLQKRNKKKFSNVDELLKYTIPKTENVKSSSKRRKSLSNMVDNVEKRVGKRSERKGGKKKKEEREGEFGLEEYSSSSEMLSQLCLMGRDPLRSYSFGSMISSFFTGFRGFVVGSVEEKQSEKKKSESQVKRKKKDEKNMEGSSVISDEEKMSGRRKKRETQSQAKRKKKMNEEGILVISDERKTSSKRKERGTQSQSKGKKKEEVNKEGDSVISDEEKLSGKRKKRETQSEGKRKKEQEGNSVISNEEKPSGKKKKSESESQTKSRRRRNTKEKEDTNLKGNSVISSSEKPTRQKKKQPESKSTTQKKKKQEPNLDGNSVISNNKSSDGNSVISAIVLNFNDPNAVPSETELNKFFTRFGPLHEDETVILKESSRAEVVFKNRADAELAFDKAGKFDVFGKGLVSFRLSFVKRL